MRLIPLTKGMFAQVDDADFETVSRFSWHALKGAHTYYAVRDLPEVGGRRPGVVLMHRQLLAVGGAVLVDHEDGNGLNNQRTNIRPCTKAQNCQNARVRADSSSGFKGVNWNARRGAWAVRVQAEGRRRFVGYFEQIEDAIAAAHRSRAELHKEFARG